MDLPNWLIVIFLCLSVTLLAQSSITVYTYNAEKRTKDLNFYWSCLVLIGSIFGTIASLAAGVMVIRGSAAAPGGGVPAVEPGIEGAFKAQAARAQNVAAAAENQAKAAANAAKAVALAKAAGVPGA